MISIVMPVYNAAKFLAPMVDSVLNQSYRDIELLLVNDGSTDESSNICHEYASRFPNVKVFDLENGGPSRARNFGVSQATGEFVWFMDSDDILEDGALESAVNAQKAHGADVVIGGMNFCFTYKNEIVPKAVEQEMVLTPEAFIRNYPLLHQKNYVASLCNKLIRRSLIVENNLAMDERLHMYEDYLYCMDTLLCAKKIVCLPTVFYDYRILSSGSLSRRYRPNTLQTFRIFAEKFQIYFEKFANIHANDTLNLQNSLIYLAYECVKNESRSPENPKKKIRALVRNVEFQNALRPCKGSGRRYKIVLLLMKSKLATVLWLYCKK